MAGKPKPPKPTVKPKPVGKKTHKTTEAHGACAGAGCDACRNTGRVPI
jgi:hypothetical protein